MDISQENSGIWTFIHEYQACIRIFSVSIRSLTYSSIFEKNKKTPLFVKITKRGVSNYIAYFPFDTVIRLTAR
jgi:hypothetical protein